MKLRPQRRLDPLAGFVTLPQVITERLDDVVGRDADMRRTPLDCLQHGIEDAKQGAERPVGLREAAQTIKMTEQFVRSIDEMDDHRLQSLKMAEPRALRHSCSSATTRVPRFHAPQRHGGVHPLDSVARVAKSLRAFLYGLPASTRY